MIGRAAALVVGVAALALAGCGGGGGSSVPSSAPPGQRVFTDSCSTCHKLAAAKATGTVGPDLDHKGLTAAAVADTVRHGATGMPAFSDQLSDMQIQQVAQFVAKSSH